MESATWGRDGGGSPMSIVALLKACAKQKNLQKGCVLHAEILLKGWLEKSIYIGNTLVRMYAHFGALAKAQEVFDKLRFRDGVSWNVLISGYLQHGHSEDALKCYDQMKREGHLPDAVTLVCILKACGSIGAVDKGEEVYDLVVREGLLEKNTYIGTALVDMYAKCGALEKALKVFNKLRVRDVFSWTALISGYAQHGYSEEALNCFESMQCTGLSPNVSILVNTLRACGNVRRVDKGKLIHSELIRRGLLKKDVVVGTALVAMYANCGALEKAQEVFNELQGKNIVSWNALITGYVQHGHSEEALNCFEQVQSNHLSPNAVTFVCALKACGITRTVDKGEKIHREIVRNRLLEKNVLVGTALVNMYAKCGKLGKAKEVFDELQPRNVVSWTALIAGYAQKGLGEEALNCFDLMQQEGLSPDEATLVSVLKACGVAGAAYKGNEIHAYIVKQRLVGKDSSVATAVVDMYAKCGELVKAKEVFDQLPVCDVLSWNALFAGYLQHGHADEALNCFQKMKCSGLTPNAYTFFSALKACGSIGAADKGQEVHDEIVREELLERNSLIGTALVDMYCKCGALEKAQQVFDELRVHDVVTWTVLIAGYAHLGKDDKTFESFNKMLGEGVEPNLVTFTVVLDACSNAGLLESGQLFFEVMRTDYGITPTLEHYTCMIDIFGRAGVFYKVVALIKVMPTTAYLPAWVALLGACRKWGNVKLGRLAFEHAVQLNADDSAAYVCMGNLYADAVLQVDVEEFDAVNAKKKATLMLV